MEVEFIEGKFYAKKGKKEIACSICGVKLNEGYVCENDKQLILCKRCQDKYPMQNCKHDAYGEHRHIKFFKKDYEEDEDD